MCGLTVWISRNPINYSIFRAMNDQVAHRGPDDSGVKIEEQDGVWIGFGHQRLSIIDISSGGYQPMERCGCVIVYNGEIYNYRELKDELKSQGWSFYSESDTEVLLASYRQWGTDCLDHLNGMFAFVIHDRPRNRVFAARDRFGIKPLYYRASDSDIQFVSEIKQLAVTDSPPRTADGDAIANFLVNRYHDHSASTFFKDVQQIEPGHFLILDLATLSFQIRQWYDLHARVAGKRPTDPTEFKELFESAVALRMRADVEVGSSLSGGLDSTAIVSTADTMVRSGAPYSLKTVTASFSDDSLDEWPLVNKLSERTRIKALRIRPDASDFLAILDDAIWAQDEPIWSESILAQYMIFQAAKHAKLKVMLDGQGGDEFLLGYIGHSYPHFVKEMMANGHIGSLLFEVIHGMGKNVAKWATHSPSLNPHRSEQALNILQYPFNDASTDFMVNTESATQAYSLNQAQKHLRALLHYEDRNSMAASIETRLPFLDYRLVEFNLRLDSREKIRAGMGKSILRKAMADRLPREICCNRKKIGFKPSENDWSGIIQKELGSALMRLSDFDFFQSDVLSNFNAAPEDRSYSARNIGLATRLLAVDRWLHKFSINAISAS